MAQTNIKIKPINSIPTQQNQDLYALNKRELEQIKKEE